MTATPVNLTGYTPIELRDKEFEQISRWVYDIAGIRLSDNKKALVTSRLGSRLRELRLTSFHQYLDIIANHKHPLSVTERQKALNLLTTNETFFFREIAHFDFIREVILPLKQGRKLRCWSAASSTGEEAYSLAMELATHHSGLWEIIGTDINVEVIERASKGVYPLTRIDHIPTAMLHQYCLKGAGAKAGTFKIKQELRRHVHFSQANLQQPPESLGSFDLVFLRNVMIYFDLQSKTHVVENVLRHLKPGGHLLIGHAESLNGISDKLTLIRPSVYIAG
ncbi:methyltransferase domain-containing protein [Shewanella avicenniae]|uniref:Chemotaxis protein methyltransferase n=1 Tax=Shewanella avicenniae TaxID=2814294 RepID=A0ABX7QQI8_9GAMM|nr:CheR family methyltransferase [Shewanella avicenniae]QSX33191.1 methyltransferase domain-containing protein [Shewanella avicenniae]